MRTACVTGRLIKLIEPPRRLRGNNNNINTSCIVRMCTACRTDDFQTRQCIPHMGPLARFRTASIVLHSRSLPPQKMDGLITFAMITADSGSPTAVFALASSMLRWHNC